MSMQRSGFASRPAHATGWPLARAVPALGRVLLSLAFLSLGAGPVRAGGLDAMNRFLKETKTGQAEFKQTVRAPGRPDKVSTGRFEFERPGRFRFEYVLPFAQSIVADGHDLWMYDPDLQQVTRKSQADALGSTPAALLAGGGDVQRDFVLRELSPQDGFERVEATPKDKDSPYAKVVLSFQGRQPASLEITDRFGQVSLLSFSAYRSPVKWPSSHFRFQVPPNAQVIQP